MFATFERDRIIRTMIVGFCVGVVSMFCLGAIVEPENALQNGALAIFAGFVLCGMPYVWLMLPKLYNIFNPATWVLFVLKFLIAAMGGFVITPICLVVRIVQSIVYHSKMKRYSNFADA